MSAVDLDAVKARALHVGVVAVAVDGLYADLLNAVMESWRDLGGLVARITELEAERDSLWRTESRLHSERDEARAQIAAARERLHAGSVPLGMSETAFLQKSILDALAILSQEAERG